ncbi:sugar phosphate isomerase/epimerase family protein [Paenibacillus roseipurpureus]|uniref:Sugar phosphate isomerase/epimerase family protein n=1 Tax=Paenibacillus roseopurpureus TaxID=2918901 RepID=A0AA96LM24_9BACL|nr:sugar phosphate isomerase/epimerase family protein [Paenibacillus sp. MBLB1832]WNR43484.1 sugar phosphate isomerase/epimerase family protein [Paenibacillus sp. MBLB1832]
MGQFQLSAFSDEIGGDLEFQMDVLEQYGIKHIEMRGVNGKGLVQNTREEVLGIKRQLADRGFKLSSVGSPIGKIKITDDFEPHLELFRYTLEIAEILEAPYIRLFSFFIPEGENPAIYRDEVLRRMSTLVKEAEGTGVTLLHENEAKIYGDTPERCLDLLDSINSPHFKAIFDPANYIHCGVNCYPDAFYQIKKHLAYMHIKDATLEPRITVPAGYGIGHLYEILNEIHSEGKPMFLSLEPHLSKFTIEQFAKLEPNSPIIHMPEGGARTFAMAATSLIKLIRRIEEEAKQEV